MEFARDLVTIASMGLTLTTVVGCLGVIYMWWGAAWKAWKTSHRTELHYFIMGVSIGFFGALVDNVYWGFAWFAEFINHPYRDSLFDYGVYSNLFFRQLCTILAAAFHIQAAVESTSRTFRIIVVGGWVLGVAAMVPMYLFGSLG